MIKIRLIPLRVTIRTLSPSLSVPRKRRSDYILPAKRVVRCLQLALEILVQPKLLTGNLDGEYPHCGIISWMKKVGGQGLLQKKRDPKLTSLPEPSKQVPIDAGDLQAKGRVFGNRRPQRKQPPCHAWRQGEASSTDNRVVFAKPDGIQSDIC